MNINSPTKNYMPKETFDKVMALIKELEDELQPYIGELDAKTKKRLLHLGNRTSPFAEKAVEFTRTNPKFIPLNLDADKLQLDLAAWKKFGTIKISLMRVLEMVNNSESIYGNMAYKASLHFYSSVTMASEASVPEASNLKDQLFKFFRKDKHRHSKKNQKQVPPASDTPDQEST